jgi:DNA-directed RNA polymerase subunit L
MFLSNDIKETEIKHPVTKDCIFRVKVSHEEDLMSLLDALFQEFMQVISEELSWANHCFRDEMA